jgi:hypothetical protein
MGRVLPEQLTAPLPVKKFPAFYGTRKFITAFTTDRHLSLPSAIVHVPSYLLKTNFNIILSYTPRSSTWPLSFRFPYQSHVLLYHTVNCFHFYAECFKAEARSASPLFHKIHILPSSSVINSRRRMLHPRVTPLAGRNLTGHCMEYPG